MKNDLDDKITATLQSQSKELEALVDGGLLEYLKHGFDNSFAGVMKLGYVIAIVLSIVMFWLAYKFFTVVSDEQVFWGVLLIITFLAQVATKLWIFMQTNRNILSRELRMLELRLLAQLVPSRADKP